MRTLQAIGSSSAANSRQLNRTISTSRGKHIRAGEARENQARRPEADFLRDAILCKGLTLTARSILNSPHKQQIGTRLFYAVSAVKLVDVAAFIELLDKLCVDETLDFKLGHRGIALFHQTLHIVKTFH